MRNLLIFAGISMMLSSCYSDIDFPGLMPNPVPVINAVTSTDTVVIASISRTYSIDEDIDDLFIKDADVRLTVNGSYSEQMTMVEYDTIVYIYPQSRPWHVVNYVSNYRPQPGDSIEIVAATPYGTARATDVVPHPVEIERVEALVHLDSNPSGTTGGIDGTCYDIYHGSVTYHLYFHDPADEANYYFVSIDNQGNYPYIGYIHPVFELQNQDLTNIGDDLNLGNSWGWTFSDETIDGLDYSLSLTESVVIAENEFDTWTMPRRARLYAISENYYKYLRSVLRNQQREESAVGDIGILQPIVIFSNVEGGTGIFGTSCRDEYIFNVVYNNQ